MASHTGRITAKAYVVAAAAVSINLALGILYAWSIFKESIKQSLGCATPETFCWDPAAINDPYAVSCIVFSLAMIPAGRLHDRLGPRPTALCGALLVGAGFLLVGATTSYWAWVLGFGVMVGLGIGCGTACTTPVAIKWFPPSRTGLASGIVVAGAGLAPIYIAPLAAYFLDSQGLSHTLRIFGIGIWSVVSVFALLLLSPPKQKTAGPNPDAETNPSSSLPTDSTPLKIISSSLFWKIWLLYFCASGAGLMVIGSVAGMAGASMGAKAFWAVALVALGNALGRITAGAISDHIGRENTLMGFLVMQAISMFMAIRIVDGTIGGAATIVSMAVLIGFNYGTNLALFPALTKDLWGIENFGMNYGLLFTAWGAGGFFMARVSQSLLVSFGNYSPSLVCAGAMCGLAAWLAYRLKKRFKSDRRVLGSIPVSELLDPSYRPNRILGRPPRNEDAPVP